MDAYKKDVLLPQLTAESVDTANSLRKRNILLFRNKKVGIVATIAKMLHDRRCNETVVGVLTETTIRGTLPGGLDSMTVVDENSHSRCV